LKGFSEGGKDTLRAVVFPVREKSGFLKIFLKKVWTEDN
jgi:hypothetical protein